MYFVHESVIEASVEEVFAFHERPDAFQLLLPPWEKAQVLQPPRSLQVGTVVKVRTRVGPLWIDVVAEHVAYEKNQRFEDVMLRGPFAKWHHKHLFLPAAVGCTLRDEIEYEPPLGPLFKHRHEVTRREVLAARR
jgi:ligand-binding SRPBCC domain-containing protein